MLTKGVCVGGGKDLGGWESGLIGGTGEAGRADGGRVAWLAVGDGGSPWARVPAPLNSEKGGGAGSSSDGRGGGLLGGETGGPRWDTGGSPLRGASGGLLKGRKGGLLGATGEGTLGGGDGRSRGNRLLTELLLQWAVVGLHWVEMVGLHLAVLIREAHPARQ